MKKLSAHFISGDTGNMEFSEISGLLDQFPKHPLDNLLWTKNGYTPEVSFIIAYSYKSIFLKYWVKEEHIRAFYLETNGPVYKDSCVEAFIAFDNKGYYNLEFNCVGTALMGYGPGIAGRVHINKSLVDLIETYQVMKSQANDSLIKWELTLDIPFAVFEHHQITSLKNQTAKMNFYKCGDELPEPHFLSWNNIINPEPNFHLPKFFGQVKFVA